MENNNQKSHVEWLAEQYWSKQPYNEDAFIKGYQTAEKELPTWDDVQKAWNAAYIDALSIDEENYKPLFFEDFIKKLKEEKK